MFDINITKVNKFNLDHYLGRVQASLLTILSMGEDISDDELEYNIQEAKVIVRYKGITASVVAFRGFDNEVFFQRGTLHKVSSKESSLTYTSSKRYYRCLEDFDIDDLYEEYDNEFNNALNTEFNTEVCYQEDEDISIAEIEELLEKLRVKSCA